MCSVRVNQVQSGARRWHIRTVGTYAETLSNFRVAKPKPCPSAEFPPRHLRSDMYGEKVNVAQRLFRTERKMARFDWERQKLIISLRSGSVREAEKMKSWHRVRNIVDDCQSLFRFIDLKMYHYRLFAEYGFRTLSGDRFMVPQNRDRTWPGWRNRHREMVREREGEITSYPWIEFTPTEPVEWRERVIHVYTVYTVSPKERFKCLFITNDRVLH